MQSMVSITDPKIHPTFDDEIDECRYWSKKDRKLWGLTLLGGTAAVYAARFTMPVTVSEIAQELNWSKTTSGTVLSSFFWGYAMTQIVGGYLADRLGGEVVLTSIGIIWSLMTFWTPEILHMLDFSKNPVFALKFFVIYRVVYGAAQGMHFPSTTNLIASRLPSSDKNSVTGVVFSGGSVGVIICGALASVFRKSPWSYIYRIIGALSISWIFLLRYMVENDRRKYKIISLKSNMSTTSLNKSTSGNRVPWMLILSHKSFWAVVFAHFFHSSTWFIIFSWIPTYFHEKYPQSATWIFSTLPYALSVFTSIIAGYASEYLFKKGWSLTFIRKLMHLISQSTVAASMIMMGVINSYSWTVFFLCMAMGASSITHSSSIINPQDLVPDYAGSVFGVMNTAGAIPGFVGVYICGYILETTGSWTYIFNLAALCNIISLMVFLLFGSAKKIPMTSERLPVVVS